MIGLVIFVVSIVGLMDIGFSFVSSASCSIVLGYLPSYFDGSEKTGSRYWDWFATHPFWNFVFGYFPGRIEYEDKTTIDPKGQYIFASHPHGPISVHHGMYLTNGARFHEVSPGSRRRDVGANVVFKIPLYREWALWTGLVSADPDVCKSVLSQGRSLVVLVGGMDEQLISEYGEHHVFLRQRKGFVKLALQFGIPLVPMYCFGETDLFKTSRWAFGIRKFLLKKFRLAFPLARGLWWCPIIPFKKQLVCCVSTPIPVPRVEHPTQTEIDSKHEEYVLALQTLFDKNKARLGFGTKELVIT